MAKRCNLFDDDGEPIRNFQGGYGCTKGSSCRFTHPEDPEWKYAKPSAPPPSSYLHPSVIKDLDYSTSSRSPTKERPYGSEHLETDSPLEMYGPSRPPTNDRPYSPSSRGKGSRSRRSLSPTIQEPHRSRDERRSSWGSTDPSRIAGPKMLPDEPTIPAPLVPPPPLPEPPLFISGPRATSTLKSEEPVENRQEIWLERVKILSEASKSHTELYRLKQEVQSFRRMKNSAAFLDFPEEEKADIQHLLAKNERQSMERRTELEMTVARLMTTNFWPVLNPPDMQGAEERYHNLKEVVTELRDVVTEVNQGLTALVADRNAKAALELASMSEQSLDMDVDRRPLKRRRMDEGAKAGVFDGGREHAIEFNETSDRLQNLDVRLSDLQNDWTQRDNDIRDEINLHVDAKWEELGPPAIAFNVGSAADGNKLQEVEKNVNNASGQLGELADEVGKLMVRDPEVDAEIKRLKELNATMVMELAEDRLNIQRMRDQLERDKKQMDALSAALNAYIAQPRLPSPSPAVPSQAEILEALEEPITASVRAQVQPLLNGLRERIETTMKAQNEEMYGTLWAKMQLTLRMVNAIAKKVEQEQRGNVL